MPNLNVYSLHLILFNFKYKTKFVFHMHANIWNAAHIYLQAWSVCLFYVDTFRK